MSISRPAAADASSMLAEACRVLVAAVWQGRRLPAVGQPVLELTRRLARWHTVERRLLATYPECFRAADHRRLEELEERLWVNLREAACRLRAAGMDAVYIKSGQEAASISRGPALVTSEYGDFDLVVGSECWEAALAALEGWGAGEPSHPLEPHKRMFRPRRGPGAHLHRDAEWFGVPVIRAPELRARSHPLLAVPGLLLPSSADGLRLWIAHALFQNLGFDLSELLEVRRLADVETAAEARALAAREGWEAGFLDTLARARLAIEELDAGGAATLPVTLPALASLLHGWGHAARLMGRGDRGPALREMALRPALVAAKQRRRWRP